MMFKLKYCLSIFVLLIIFPVFCNTDNQVQIHFIQGRKNIYKTGDKIELQVTVYVPDEICPDGMDKTKLFISGIKIVRENSWEHIKRGVWQKKLTLEIVGNKKGVAKLTVYRRADKGSFTFQERFNLE